MCLQGSGCKVKKKDIISLKPTERQKSRGSDYALKTLPWTFNRMMNNTSTTGQNSRALNIAKGVVAQSLLKSVLAEMGIRAEEEKKSHRDSDLFDLRFRIGDKETKFDFKSFNVYTDYSLKGREPFSIDFLLNHQSYSGPKWTEFFPMLVPHTQIKQDKEAYIFALGTSRDFRKWDPASTQKNNILATFPFGESLPFYMSPKLCLEREKAKQGFFVKVSIENNVLANSKGKFILTGEYNGKTVNYELYTDVKNKVVGPFSCLSSLWTKEISTLLALESMTINLDRNEMKSPVLSATRKNLNVEPEEIEFRQRDFCNLILPDDYEMHVLGWITKEGYRARCLTYPAWIWPKDSEDKYSNQSWKTFSDGDRTAMSKMLGDELEPTNQMGIMKTTGRGGGAACYFYPNIHGGGIKETNFYVLLSDLTPIRKLK
jgi:hypothetical protein